jgi:hypothetical protein
MAGMQRKEWQTQSELRLILRLPRVQLEDLTDDDDDVSANFPNLPKQPLE